MAARWGVGEEMLTACKLEYFSSATFDESVILQEGLCHLQHNGLDTGDALEALHGCLEPSILSIFDNSIHGEVKSGFDEESEATLLTALTEILDNVDDENMSPFDTLPDMDLLKAQRDQEHFSIYGDDGECAAASFSELIQDLDISSEQDWCLPISLEQDGATVSVTLSDLVKQMHPYAITLCVEGEEQLLPEEGIILEVMNKGEHGEPILAIPDLSLPLSLDCLEDEHGVSKSSPEKASHEHEETPSVLTLSKVSLIGDNEVENVKINQPNKKTHETRFLKKRKKWKTKETKTSIPNQALKLPSKELGEQKKKKKVSFAPLLTVDENKKCPVKITDLNSSEVQVPMKILTPNLTTTANPPSQFCADVNKYSNIPEEKATSNELHSDKCQESAVPPEQQTGVDHLNEPKQKSLSLQQYRLLRLQKKPSPLKKVDDNSMKWPTLPEAPKELPPIPCLNDPSSKDPRCMASTSVKKEFVSEIMPAWQPRGPGAPPTPQALLVPPASMLAGSKNPVTSAVSSPNKKPPETIAAPTSSSAQPNKIPVSASMAENTISSKVLQTAKKALTEITQSLPMTSTVGQSPNFPAAEQIKFLQSTSSVSHQITVSQISVPSNQEIHQAQVVPEITATTTKMDASKPTLNNNAASRYGKMGNVSVPKQAKAIALQPFASTPIQARIMKLAEQMRLGSASVPKAKSCTSELFESFRSEIGIEASDLTSLLEQFEETQTQEEQNVPQVCGKAAAVGNSGVDKHAEPTNIKTCNPDLGSTAGLTPPATPPHQPLAPVALLVKPPYKSELPKSTPTKTIQTEPLPLPVSKVQCKPQTSTTLGVIQPFSIDHDYCLLSKEPSQNELANHCPARQQPTTAKSKPSVGTGYKLPSDNITKDRFQENVKSLPSVCKNLTTTDIVTPDASPDTLESQRFQGHSECSSSPRRPERGRKQRKYRTRLPSRSRSESSSSGTSGSPSPPRKRYKPRSPSRSPSHHQTHSSSRQRRYSYSSSSSDSCSHSRSRSSSRSRSPSPSPPRRARHLDAYQIHHRRYNYCYDLNNNKEIGRQKEKAIEERRVVYIGRINGSMTRKELRERFSYFGEIEECTVHFREHGDNYGFVTYYNTKDAYNAIENGSKLRQPNELPFDLCFGGRRQFCRSSYADLDSNCDFDPSPTKARVHALDFDTLLKQAQRNLKR